MSNIIACLKKNNFAASLEHKFTEQEKCYLIVNVRDADKFIIVDLVEGHLKKCTAEGQDYADLGYWIRNTELSPLSLTDRCVLSICHSLARLTRLSLSESAC